MDDVTRVNEDVRRVNDIANETLEKISNDGYDTAFILGTQHYIGIESEPIYGGSTLEIQRAIFRYETDIQDLIDDILLDPDNLLFVAATQAAKDILDKKLSLAYKKIGDLDTYKLK